MLDQTHRVVWRLLDHLSQKQLLVCGLDLGEVALDPVELRTVRHVEDLGDVQCLKEQLCILGLVHGQVVEEQREVTAPKLLGELADEGDEDVGVDRSGVIAKSMRPPSSLMAAMSARVCTFKSESLTLTLSIL